MKIGYVLKVFPRLSETFILNEILELERQGVDVQIFSLKSPSDGRFHAGLGALRAEVVYLLRAGPTSSSSWESLRHDVASAGLNEKAVGEAFLDCLEKTELKVFLQALSLAAAVRNLGIDHLHAHFATVATRVAMLAHRMSGVSFSFTAHAKDIYHCDADHRMIAEAARECAFAVTVTDYNLKQLQAIAPDLQGKIVRIYNGVQLDRFTPAPFPVESPPLVLAVGRLVEKKGFDYLIEACRTARDWGLSFQCSIAGTGLLEPALRRKIEELCLEDTVMLVGAQSHEAILDLMRRAQVVVLPCVVGEDGNRDALPTVLMEAMAVGRPVVSTYMEGPEEMVTHGDNGILVPQRDSRELAEAIFSLVENPTLCSVLGRRGRQRVEEFFDLSVNVATLFSFFDRVVRESSPSPLRRVGGGTAR